MKISSVISIMSDNPAMVIPLTNTIEKFKVVNAAVFLGQMLHESANLTRLRENLNYSVVALLGKFGHHRISETDARAFGRSGSRAADQQAIANRIYGGEWGRENLGNTQPNDGWHFRGVGVPQLTGRANITAFAKYMGRDPELRLDPGIIERDLQLAADAAGWYWTVYKPKLNDPKITVAQATRLVTGSEAQAYAERSALTTRARTLLNSPEPK